MRRCIGSPCSTYLVLHSRDVSPAASLAISSRLMPASGSCVPVPVTSGRTGGGGQFENLKKKSFFSKRFYICFVLSLVCILTVLS
ncbi:unnamed protein product, partial [Staurois parvus]